MARETHGSTVHRWKRLIDALADKETVPELKDYREQLETMYQEALELSAKRDAHRAAKQEASLALKETLERGRRMNTVMRIWIKNHYGPDSERLVEFGIRPRRLVRKKHKPAE
jgi:hypothetical protein